MKFFRLLKYIFLLIILGISIMIILLWNIQEDLPDSNISKYFPNEITKIYDENYDLLYLSLIHISEPTRQAEISYAVFCLKKKKKKTKKTQQQHKHAYY